MVASFFSSTSMRPTVLMVCKTCLNETSLVFTPINCCFSTGISTVGTSSTELFSTVSTLGSSFRCCCAGAGFTVSCTSFCANAVNELALPQKSITGNIMINQTIPTNPLTRISLLLIMFRHPRSEIVNSGNCFDPRNGFFPFYKLPPIQCFVIKQGLQPVNDGNRLNLSGYISGKGQVKILVRFRYKTSLI